MKILLIILGTILFIGMLLSLYTVCKVASSVEHDYEEDLEEMRREYEKKKTKGE